MKTSALDFELPRELIAQRALPRGESRLLHLDRESGVIRHRRFPELVERLEPGDLLVVNDTKVLAARLSGVRARDGRRFEVLLVRPARRDPGVWDCMVRGGKKLRVGDRLSFSDGFWAIAAGRSGDLFCLDFATVDVASEAARCGEIPLPPYIDRPIEESDASRYQTVYANRAGAVAAPTAGLHFTPELLDEIRARGVEVASVTLEVGPGTFRPISAEEVEDHPMDVERCSISRATAEAYAATRRRGARVCAVGTTSVRVLETFAAEDGQSLRAGDGETDLYVRPGHRFRAVDALLTNFHLPRSSLLLLVGAMVGVERLLAAYEEAVTERYRFYSYGDAMWID